MIGKRQKPQPVARAVQTAASASPFPALDSYVPLQTGENRLYAALREAVPIIDAGIDKIIRLIGSFTVRCGGGNAETRLNSFLQNVKVNSMEAGVQSFLNDYLSQLLTYGWRMWS